jgi:indolepyruvate ferredoxin oxidoreductase, alpha subunit
VHPLPSDPTCSEDFLTALAQGLLDGGCSLATNYPGFRSNELADQLGCAVTSVDEKNAFAVAWGACLAGKRSVVCMKNVGLNDGADAFLNAVMLGVNAGLVLVVFDDMDMDHSQIRQDSRHYFDFFGGLWLEPADAGRAYVLGREALTLSETFGMPVVIRVTNILALKGRNMPGRSLRDQGPASPFRRDPARWVVHPANARGQEQALVRRRDAIQRWVDDRPLSLPEPAGVEPVQISVGGKVFGRRARSMDVVLETLPLPSPLLDFMARSTRPVHVHERGDGFVAEKLRAARGTNGILHFRKPPVLRNRQYHNRDDHEPLFAALRSLPKRFVAGDLGTYTMDPHQTIDACLCYGTSVGVATGFALASPESRVVCVTGDGAFLHSGKAAVQEAAARGARLTVFVLDNGGCRGTGGQAVPGDFHFADPKIEVLNAGFQGMNAENPEQFLAPPDADRLVRVVVLREDRG